MILEFGISCENDAFSDGNGRHEMARLMRQTADRIEAGEEGGTLVEVNGNRCGSWYIEEPDKDFEEEEQ
jgi:UDP-N-acetylglucosamine pyrophosphorylase